LASHLGWPRVLATLCSSLPQVSVVLLPGIFNANETAKGACGLVNYTLVGIYKEIRNIRFAHQDDCPADLVRQLGEAEYKQATDTDKLYVVRVWCQTTMRVRLV
jgi:hypothetical protein